MKTSTVLGLGGLAALAWYLTRRRDGIAVPSPFGPHTDGPDDLAIAGTDYIGRYDWFLSQGGKSDKCDLPGGDYDADRHTAWSDEQRRCVSEYRAGRAQSFYEQVWAPASRVPITSLTPEDFKLAVLFLANRLDRRGVPWTYGQSKAVNDYNDTVGAAAEALKIVVPLLDALSFGAASKAGGAIAESIDPNANLGDFESSSSKYEAAVTALPVQTQGGENFLVIKEGPFVGDPTFGTTDPLFHQYTKAWDAVFVDPTGPSTDFGYEPIEFPWGNLYFRCQLLARDPQGFGSWKFPWVSREMGYPYDNGDGGSLTDKSASAGIIAKQARMFRTLDVLGAMLKPDVQQYAYGSTLNADGGVNAQDLVLQKRVHPGLYAYKVGLVELWGATLPATAEDNAQDLTDIVGKSLAGSTYDRGNNQTTTQTAESDYRGTQAPIPTPTQVAQSSVPSVNKGVAPPSPTQTSQSAYAGATPTSPPLAGLGRHASRII